MPSAFGVWGLGCNPRYKQRYMIAKSVAVGLCEAIRRNGDAPATKSSGWVSAKRELRSSRKAPREPLFEQPSEFIKLSAAQNNKLCILFSLICNVRRLCGIISANSAEIF